MPFFKNGEQRGKISPVWGLVPAGSVKRVNTVEILPTHIWKWKNVTSWNYSRNGVREIKENDGEGEFNSDTS
jgi:hypothetical protein